MVVALHRILPELSGLNHVQEFHRTDAAAINKMHTSVFPI